MNILTSLASSCVADAAVAVVVAPAVVRMSLLDMMVHKPKSTAVGLASMLVVRYMLILGYLVQHLARLTHCTRDWRTGYLKGLVRTPVALCMAETIVVEMCLAFACWSMLGDYQSDATKDR